MHPWEIEGNEPREFDHAGLRCLIMRGPMGQWNGYVQVPEHHPFHGYSYNECPLGSGWEHYSRTPEGMIHIHGGLTFGGKIQRIRKDLGGSCEETDQYPGWWFGFDTAHHMDLAPKTFNYYRGEGFSFHGETYRDLAFMEHEVRTLAEQLANIAKDNPWSKELQIPEHILDAIKGWAAFQEADKAKQDAVHLALTNIIE